MFRLRSGHAHRVPRRLPALAALLALAATTSAQEPAPEPPHGAFTATVRVVDDATDRGAPGLLVEARIVGQRGGEAGPVTATTDARGEARLALPSPDATLRLEDPSGEPWWSSVAVRMGGAERVEPLGIVYVGTLPDPSAIEVRLRHPLSLRGRVVDEDGAPLDASVRVDVGDGCVRRDNGCVAPTRTAADGRFVLRGFATATVVRIETTAEGREVVVANPRVPARDAAGEEVVIVLPRAGEVAVRALPGRYSLRAAVGFPAASTVATIVEVRAGEESDEALLPLE